MKSSGPPWNHLELAIWASGTLWNRATCSIWKSLFIALLSALVLTGCASHRPLQVADHVTRDTVYINKLHYDSIYIYKDRLTDRSKDTVYLKDISIEYRYKLLRDTVRIIQRDSIPYEVTVIETKEFTRPLTWFDHLTRLTFWFVIGSLFTWIYIRVIRITRVR